MANILRNSRCRGTVAQATGSRREGALQPRTQGAGMKGHCSPDYREWAWRGIAAWVTGSRREGALLGVML